MKNFFITALSLFWGFQCAEAAEEKIIRISTDNTDLVLQVAENGRLYQTYLGEKLLHESDLKKLDWQIHPASDASVSPRGWEVCSGSGNEDFFEPALGVTHADGNASTWLYYVSSSTKAVEGGTQTDIHLRDDEYPVNVTLHYVAYEKEDVIKTWSEISHQEKKPVQLFRYASTMLYFNRPAYYLTEFSGDWAKEVQMSTQKLEFGKKVVDTKLGSRAAMHTQPFFMVGLEAPAAENQGEVLMGTLGWTGNFSFTFEVDNVGNLRVIPAINPYASVYELQKDEVFTTPEFIFTLSNKGTGEGSRRFQNWARNYQLKDGKGTRLTLLNNWENTGFDFNQNILVDLIKETKELGVDMFLLDDGWFGKRDNDWCALGDWEVNEEKIKGGLPALAEKIHGLGLKFGLWVEPEMISEDSDLYREHPDWALKIPGRAMNRSRHQLNLDITRKEVREHIMNQIFKVLDACKADYVKWDMNRSVDNVFSAALPKERQGEVYHRYVLAVYEMMESLVQRYPDLLFESCSGGGGRFEAGMLYYSPQIWCSDDTDARERTKIQYGTSFFYPVSAVGSHVSTVPNHQTGRITPFETRAVTAMAGSFGYELDLNLLSDAEKQAVTEQIQQFKAYGPLIHNGRYYRLTNPMTDAEAIWAFAAQDGSEILVQGMIFHAEANTLRHQVKLRGLCAEKQYRLDGTEQVYTGAALMAGGVLLPKAWGDYTPVSMHFTEV